MTWRIGGSVRRWRRRIALRRRKKKQYAAGETTVEKPLGGKVKKTTFPPSLEIAQRTRDSHFPTVAATAGLRLHFQCLDGRTQGYIFKWLDTSRRRHFRAVSVCRLQWRSMIAHLRGKLLAKHPNQAIVETAGVGYDVTISVPTFSDLPGVGAEVALHIHTHVREDLIALT